MSMEIYVLSDRRLESIDAWQQAVEAAGLPLQLSTATPFAELRGAWPVVLEQRETAFECDHCHARELMAEMPEVDFGRAWTCALAFRWGADVYAGASAFAAASAYATATDRVILDCEKAKLISAERAIEISRELAQSEALIKEAVRQVVEQYQK